VAKKRPAYARRRSRTGGVDAPPLPVGLKEAKPRDLRAALRLSREPGWNQVAADWRLMLEVGDSFGVATEDGKLVASGLTVPFGRPFGWISMILVTSTFRRRGLATHLMERCIAALRSRGLVPGLDATPEGRTVYRSLGFKDVYRITRFIADAPRLPRKPPPAGVELRRMGAGDINAVARYDAPIFGADRAFMLEHLRERRPGRAFIAVCDAKIRGYVLTRDGRASAQIGPLVAEDAVTALALLSRAIGSNSGPLCIDLLDRHRAIAKELTAHGFIPLLPFIRMIYGRSQPFDDVRRVFAIAGPELG
jgi:GNAT superfamily N-acetyltransferase